MVEGQVVVSHFSFRLSRPFDQRMAVSRGRISVSLGSSLCCEQWRSEGAAAAPGRLSDHLCSAWPSLGAAAAVFSSELTPDLGNVLVPRTCSCFVTEAVVGRGVRGRFFIPVLTGSHRSSHMLTRSAASSFLAGSE